MTDTQRLRELRAKATGGEWHHVQPFQSVPASKTIHGTVPGQRVDYVSTWPGPGTPNGHRVIVPMESLTDSGIARTMSSDDMALVVAAVNELIPMCDEIDALKARVERLESALKECADELEQEFRIRHQPISHPVMQRAFNRDMVTVLAARAALKGQSNE